MIKTISKVKLILRKCLSVLPSSVESTLKEWARPTSEKSTNLFYLANLSLKWMTLQSSVKHLHGVTKISYEKDELIVTCLVRNGEIYIKSFIEHHFSLGIKHIVFLDNGSTDSTVFIASSYENVTILQTDRPYKKYETLMKKYLVKRFSRNRWNLFVDIDELFDYPASNVLSLSLLLQYLNVNSYTAVVTQMLDLFSSEGLSSIKICAGQDIKQAYNYCDISNITNHDYLYGSLSNKNVKMHFGGIRKTLFGTNNGLTKAALVFVGQDIDVFIDFHHVRNAYIADFTCVLLHYPFTETFYQKVLEAVQTDRYALSASHEYTMYWERLQKENDFSIKRETAFELESTNDLVKRDFLVISESYTQWIEAHCKESTELKVEKY